MIRYIAIGLMFCGGIGILGNMFFPHAWTSILFWNQNDSERNDAVDPVQNIFSIEPTEEDGILRVLLGGNIEGGKGGGIPSFSMNTLEQFVHTDAFFGNSTALFRDEELFIDSFSENEESIPNDHLQYLRDISLSHLFFLDSRLFLFGDFPFQLSQGYADSYGITPLRSDSAFPFFIEEYNQKICIIAFHAVRDTEVSIRDKMKAFPEGVPCFAVVDFGNTTHLEPTKSMRMLAQDLIQGGADGVIGVGQKSIFPVEIFNSKPIIYSLGEMIGKNMEGGIFTEIVLNEGKAQFFLHPIQVDYNTQEIKILSFAEASLFLESPLLESMEQVFVVEDF